jgi:hypothetical protein
MIPLISGAEKPLGLGVRRGRATAHREGTTVRSVDLLNWQKELHDLTRQPPSKDIKALILRTMRGRIDDRSAALTCGSLAETGLGLGIATVERLTLAGIQKEFWTRNGKYNTFSRKIEAATKLKLLGPVAQSNLLIVREVRNVFAHAMSDVRFTSAPIVAACAMIEWPPNRPREIRVRSRKSRFAYCIVCDQIFRTFLGYASFGWVTMTGPPPRPETPLLP